MPRPKRNNGELIIVAQVTGYKPDYVRQISAGKGKNEAITWAIARADELREEMHRQLVAQLSREYNEKFSNGQATD